jgi:hypothetical protein
LNRQIATARVVRAFRRNTAFQIEAADAAGRIAADGDLSASVAKDIMLASPPGELGIGLVERLEPRFGFDDVENDVELLPGALSRER